ncbi:ABC transporter ATP-binding protein [Streptococcus criceti]|uniref:ABC transporter, ATP-binding protein n=1 Tax=Streptococcus criceti HS-6 TaxID=873449 RepID=G5JQS2_STRCG|nr:ABC transporter ATP-binding protein [Streptococcus criceti]EHI75390.1 ABC transporter, ATP-binding protein [Streptococcus criceti HS-6]SUN43025.1 ABC transporter ATP-binding protein [Streptococcus criceti]
MEKLLQVHHVSKSYGKQAALDDVSLTISSGKIVGLLGPNGSGKTTLIKLINGLLKQSSGEIVVDGFHPSISSKRIVSYLPDTSYLNETMTVNQALNLFQDFYQDFDTDKAQALLNDLHIDAKERIKNLSKGTKEKVQLILVMSRQAKLYVLDEPIGGVDPAARDYILRTIINNYSEEASVIISTHLITDVEQILDDVIFLKDGKVLLEGNSDDIRFEHGKSIDALFREMFQS